MAPPYMMEDEYGPVDIVNNRREAVKMINDENSMATGYYKVTVKQAIKIIERAKIASKTLEAHLKCLTNK